MPRLSPNTQTGSCLGSTCCTTMPAARKELLVRKYNFCTSPPRYIYTPHAGTARRYIRRATKTGPDTSHGISYSGWHASCAWGYTNNKKENTICMRSCFGYTELVHDSVATSLPAARSYPFRLERNLFGCPRAPRPGTPLRRLPGQSSLNSKDGLVTLLLLSLVSVDALWIARREENLLHSVM